MTNQKRDRDATVDRLLAATMTRGATSPSGACLDAETLAAWADDGLNAGERDAAEKHAADCARCQELLTAMVRTAPAAPGPAASPWRLPALRWLIPLATVGAVVAMAVLLRPGAVNVRQVSQTAEPPATSAPAGTAPDAAGPSGQASRASSSLQADNASSRSQPVAPALAKQEQEPPAQQTAPETDAKRAAASAPTALLDAARGADLRLEKAQAAAERSASPPPAAAVPAAPPPPPAATAARAFSPGAPETVIVSSNPGSRWRILAGGAVQRSADAGSTWETQNTGVTVTLTAGSSPSPSVCWLVGPAGIVLLSTDGRSWTRLPFPESIQLVGVRATDTQTATVSLADGREFATEDGGRTWTRAPIR